MPCGFLTCSWCLKLLSTSWSGGGAITECRRPLASLRISLTYKANWWLWAGNIANTWNYWVSYYVECLVKWLGALKQYIVADINEKETIRQKQLGNLSISVFLIQSARASYQTQSGRPVPQGSKEDTSSARPAKIVHLFLKAFEIDLPSVAIRPWNIGDKNPFAKTHRGHRTIVSAYMYSRLQ